MQLPRYQSQAITQLASQSPQEAAASAGALGQALANGLDVVAQVTQRITSAEAEAAADAALLDVELAAKDFLADPRWTQVELTDAKGNTVAADQVMESEWKRVSGELLARAPKIRDRQARARFEEGRKRVLAGADIELAGQMRALQVERGKALTDYTATNLARSGDYDAALASYERGLSAGLYATAEYLKRVDDLQIIRVEDDYLRRIRPDAPDADLTGLIGDVLDDARLPASRRQSLARTVFSEVERRDRAQERGYVESQKGLAASMWANLDDLTVADIQAARLRPEDKTALTKAKRAQLDEGIDDPTAVAEVSGLLAGLANGSATRDDVQSAITRNMTDGKLSGQRGTALLRDLANTTDAFWQDTTFNQLLREGDLAINNGVPSEQLLALFAREEADKRGALAIEWRQSFLAAKMSGGLTFDAQRWYRENLPRFQERSKAIAAQPTAGRFSAYGVAGKDGRTDLRATKKALDDALADGTLTPLQHQDAYREFRLDQ